MTRATLTTTRHGGPTFATWQRSRGIRPWTARRSHALAYAGAGLRRAAEASTGLGAAAIGAALAAESMRDTWHAIELAQHQRRLDGRYWGPGR